MEEPTHAHESQFWDQVADWLLGARGMDSPERGAKEIEALLRANAFTRARPGESSADRP